MTESKLMHLSGRDLSMVLEQVAGAPPAWRHFGAKCFVAGDTWPAASARPHPPTLLDNDPALSVLPTHGFGWFNQPALAGSRPGSIGDLDWAQSLEIGRAHV